MTRSVIIYSAITVFLAGSVYGQVDEIKRASSSRSESGYRSSGSSSGSGNFVGGLIIDLMFSGVVRAQQQKLYQRRDNPSIVSLDLMIQSAIQPSSYYVFNPRIRGNWGLFSTDFRMNYILEEDIDGIKHLRTSDWQILQLNIVTTRGVTARIGGGVIREAFAYRNEYPEVTTGLHIHPWGKKLSGIAEYRSAEVRREVSAHMRYSVFNKGPLHGYATAGGVFQRHYETVDVWGFQAGFTLSIF